MKIKDITAVLLIIITAVFVVIANDQRSAFAIGGEWMPLIFIPVIGSTRTGNAIIRKIRKEKTDAAQLFKRAQRVKWVEAD